MLDVQCVRKVRNGINPGTVRKGPRTIDITRLVDSIIDINLVGVDGQIGDVADIPDEAQSWRIVLKIR